MHVQAHALVVSATLIAGCTTTLTSVPVSQDTSVATGVVYTLPKQAFDIEAKLLVIECSRNGSDVTLRYRLAAATITPKLVPDAGETYSFRYEDLNSAMKITSATVVWHTNGMLKSVNADVDDRSAQVISSVASTALNLYKASVVPFLGVSVGANKDTQCGDVIDPLFLEKEKLEGTDIPDAKVADDALAKARKTYSDIRVKLLVAREQLEAAKKLTDKSEVTRLATAVKELEAQETIAKEAKGKDVLLLPNLEAKLAKVTNTLTVTVNVVGWDVLDNAKQTTTGNKLEYCTEVKTPQQAYWNDLVTKSQLKVVHKPLGSAEFLAYACVEVSKRASEKAPAAPAGASAVPASTETPPVGLYYRQPGVGAVYVKDSEDSGNRFYASGLVTLPQFGTKAVLSLKNAAFDKNAVKVQFNEDGSLSQFSFEQQAQAERVAASASGLSSSIVDLMKLRADAVTAKAQAQDDAAKKEQQKQIDALDYRIQLAQKRTELETARTPAKDDLDKQQELLKKQIELEKLRQEYAELLKKGTP